jgi:hypothetical protein
MGTPIRPGGEAKATLVAQDTYTPPIFLDGEKAFIDIKGTGFTGTVTPQYSVNYDPVAGTGDWTDISGKTWTASATENMQIDAPVFFRAGMKIGGFSAGTVDVAIRKL